MSGRGSAGPERIGGLVKEMLRSRGLLEGVERATPALVGTLQTAEATLPAVASADDRSVDQQSLPATRRPQVARVDGSFRWVVGIA